MLQEYFIYSDFTTNIVFFISLILLVLFYRNLIKTKGLFCIESYFVFFQFIIPLYVIMPFTFSYKNIYASWDFYILRNEGFINTAIQLSSIGVIFYIFGSITSKLVFGNRVKPIIILSNSVENYWFGFNNTFIKGFFLLVIILYTSYIIGSVGAQIGQVSNFGMENPVLRPLINFTLSFMSVFLLYYVSLSIYKKNKLQYLISIIVFILLFITGTRAGTLVPLIYLIFLVSYINNTKIKLLTFFKFLFFFIIFILLIQTMSNLKSGDSSFDLILNNMLYGNNFSDLRDFAWVMYGWDGNFLLGKTELAGFLSFIPSFLSDYRTEWAWGRFTTSLIIGLDPELHPGLRAGYFGESYINFGIFGIFVIGFFSGLCLNYYDILLSSFRKNNEKLKIFKYYTFGFIFISTVTSFAQSSGFFTNYVYLILLIFFMIFKEVIIKLRN